MNEATVRTAKKPVASIVIPHLNQDESLRKCLEALSLQTFPAHQVEILVVDNGSRDIPSSFVSDFPGVRLLEEQEPGPGPARNRGVRESVGDILLFIDADCIAVPDWIEIAVTALTVHDAPPIIGGDVQIAMKDSENPTMLEAYEAVFAFRQESYIKKRGFSGTGNLGTTRRVFEAVGPFPGISVAEDRVWGGRAQTLDFKTAYVPGMTVFHPSRDSFEVIYDKWRRHTTHDYNEGQQRPWPSVRWALRILAVLGSIPVHSLSVISSRRITGVAHARRR